MSVTQWSGGEVFSVRVYKSLVGRPDLVWANAYEVQYDENSPGISDPAASAAEACRSFVQFEQAFHLPTVRFNRVVFSTLVPDGQPYNPASFVSFDASDAAGSRGTDGTNPEPLSTCLFVRREVAFGRNGRVLYRGVLLGSEVSSQAGEADLVTAAQANLGGTIDTAYTALLTDLSEYSLLPVMAAASPIGQGALIVRNVTQLTVAGVTIKSTNNRYFDRA